MAGPGGLMAILHRSGWEAPSPRFRLVLARSPTIVTLFPKLK